MKRVILLGMSGFGNAALKAILNSNSFIPVAVFISKKDAFHIGQSLEDMAKENSIFVFKGFNFRQDVTKEIVESLQPDLIIIATFRQIIPQVIINIPTIGVINIHPSLLPKYRGSTPIEWVFYKEEKETGVTVHWVEDEKPDSGRVIIKKRVPIDYNMNLQHLWDHLIEVSESLCGLALCLISSWEKDWFVSQKESEATWYPHFSKGRKYENNSSQMWS